MRADRKASEKAALGCLARALRAHGIPPIHAPEVTDAPDALFLIQGKAVAVECRYVANPELLKFMGMRSIEPQKAYEVVLPREPHLWVKEAIEAKSVNVRRYLARTGATEAWLLLHSSHYHRILREDAKDDDIPQLLRLGTHLTQHSFTRVWFAELVGKDSMAIELYAPDMPKPHLEFDEYLERFPQYPVDRFWFLRPFVQESSDGEKSVRIDLNDMVVEPVCLQPMDRRFKIDYSEFLADPRRNSNLRGLEYAFYDKLPKA